MATFKPLLVLKSSTLKSLAVSLGVNSTGTKSQLALQIVSACCETVPFFERPRSEGQTSCKGTPEAGLDPMALGTEVGVGKGEREKRKDKRVLSIDMGIRNLAMCVLEVPDPALRRAGTRRKKGKVTESLPKVLAWERVAVAKKPEEVEEPPPASTTPPGEEATPTGQPTLRNKKKRKRKDVMEVSPPGGDLGPPKLEGVPSEEVISKNRRKPTEESPPEGGGRVLEQDVSSGQTSPRSRRRSEKGKRVAEVTEEPPPKKERKVPKKPLEKKGSEMTEEVNVPPDGEQRALEQEVSLETSKSKSRPNQGKGVTKVMEMTELPPLEDEVTEVKKLVEDGQEVGREKDALEERTPEVTEVTEVPNPSGEKEVFEPKQIRLEEVAIPDDKRSRKRKKAIETPPLEEERKAPKQEEIPPNETIPGSKSKPRKGRKVAEITETQSLKELVSPIPTPDQDLSPGKALKNHGRLKRKPKKKAESFEPSVYALLTNTFVRHILDRFSPLDAVLIERQRYRSSSAAAIQEWTVRVNMFEAMLHAVFHCLHGKDSPVAESVSPHRVTRFWVDRVGERFLEIQKKPQRRKKKEVPGEELGEELGVEGVEVVIKREKTYRKTKLAKVSLVKDWLRSGDVVNLGKDAKGVAADFEPVKRRRELKSASGGKGKLDDLADCLLQGMAWIRWEENRKSLAEGKLIPEFIPSANSKS